MRASFLIHRWLSFHCVTWQRVHWISGLFCVCARSYLTLCDPWTVVHQVPLSLEFSRQENWGGLPFPSPGDLPNPGIKPVSLVSPALAGRFFTTASPEKPKEWAKHPLNIVIDHFYFFLDKLLVQICLFWVIAIFLWVSFTLFGLPWWLRQ